MFEHSLFYPTRPHMIPRLLLAIILSASVCPADEALDSALDVVAPGVAKWATVGVVDAEGHATWTDYRGTGAQTNFWPASSIKLYAVVAALELIEAPDTTCIFEHQTPDGRWHTDAARTLREMMSEVFKRSSNEDYTLLLRLVGIDRINTQFLTPERGFPSSALMRGYVKGRPWEYVQTEPQRIHLANPDGTAARTIEHTWSGRDYAKERHAPELKEAYGNMTSPRELGECLRRLFFHEHLPREQRYGLTPDQLQALRYGTEGFSGLEAKATDPCLAAMASVLPDARFYHKPGVISSFALDNIFVDAGTRKFIIVPVVNAGHASPQPGGEALVSEMTEVQSTS
jgi:hypothetical protein